MHIDSVWDLEEEYWSWEFPFSDIIGNVRDAESVLTSNIEEIQDFIKEEVRDLVFDGRELLEAIIAGDVFASRALRTDISFLRQQIKYAKEAKEVQKQLLNSLTEENYQEVVRLGDFCCSYYFSLEEKVVEQQLICYHNIERGFEENCSFSMMKDIDCSYQNFQRFYQKQFKSIKNEEVVSLISKCNF